jgi:hypothetical protein
LDKPLGYWIALITAMALVFERHKGKSALSRLVIMSISAGIGHSLAPEVALWLNRSETMAVMLLTPLGYAIATTAMAIISDRQWIKELISARLGAGGSSKEGDE